MHRVLVRSNMIGKTTRVKLASSGSLVTLAWSPDGSQFSFADVVGGAAKLYSVRADGSGLRQIPWSGAMLSFAMWSPDGKAFYFSGYQKDPGRVTTWKASPDGSNVQTFIEGCGSVQDISPDGKYLLSGNAPQGGVGFGQTSISDHSCTMLVPDLATLILHFSPDGKSILYLTASRGLPSALA